MIVSTLIEYERPNGKSPFSNWLYSVEIDKTIRARIFQRLDRLSVGNPGDHKAVGKGVFELRFKFGSGFRIYYAPYGQEIIILLCGGDKSTQRKDILLAREYWEDFKRRNQK